MPKLTIKGNIFTRQICLRRLAYYTCVFIVSSYIFTRAQRYYYEEYANDFDSSPSVPEYNKFIDQKGGFRPYFGYEILQFVVNPVSYKFTELYNHLDQQTELKQYFTFVPKSAYHVTLTKLKDKRSLRKEDLNILTQEQKLLDENDTYSLSNGKQLLIIDKQEIRLQIELTTDAVLNTVKQVQTRWSHDFPKLIDQHYTSFYITLAYQYKDIPTTATFDQLNKLLLDWQQFPVDIELGPIEICSYANLISYTPILSDAVE